MKKIIEKIKDIRLEKGYSHEYMAFELNLSQVAYSKLEKLETKLSVERLYKIADILEVKVGAILDIEPNNQFNQTTRDSSTGYLQQQQIENFYQDNKEVYEKLINAKDEQIALLKSLLQKK
jgi:transcriptional regulator with XRE-family HTH domain